MKRTLTVTGLVVIVSIAVVIMSGIYAFGQLDGQVTERLTPASFGIFIMFCFNLLFQIIFFIRKYVKYKKSLGGKQD